MTAPIRGLTCRPGYIVEPFETSDDSVIDDIRRTIATSDIDAYALGSVGPILWCDGAPLGKRLSLCGTWGVLADHVWEPVSIWGTAIILGQRDHLSVSLSIEEALVAIDPIMGCCDPTEDGPGTIPTTAHWRDTLRAWLHDGRRFTTTLALL